MQRSGGGLILQPEIASEFRVTTIFTLADVEALWRAARARLLAAPGADETMVEETIGVAEAPQIADCIALLCAPDALAGCSVGDFRVDALSDAAAHEQFASH